MTDVIRIFPILGYRDARRAVTWLHDAFGMDVGVVYSGDGDMVDHAEMFYGNGGIMLGTKRDAGAAIGADVEHQCQCGIYIIVDPTDIDAHYSRTQRAGAEIVMDLQDTEHGSRKYIAKDFEGHLWSFDTYAPVRPE